VSRTGYSHSGQPGDAPMRFPRIIKSRDMQMLKKEWTLLGYRTRKFGRCRMVVYPADSFMGYEYRRRRKIWVFKGESRYTDLGQR